MPNNNVRITNNMLSYMTKANIQKLKLSKAAKEKLIAQLYSVGVVDKHRLMTKNEKRAIILNIMKRKMIGSGERTAKNTRGNVLNIYARHVPPSDIRSLKNNFKSQWLHDTLLRKSQNFQEMSNLANQMGRIQMPSNRTSPRRCSPRRRSPCTSPRRCSPRRRSPRRCSPRRCSPCTSPCRCSPRRRSPCTSPRRHIPNKGLRITRIVGSGSNR